MKKTKKALASLAMAGMVLTMVPFNAFATGTVPTRLGGTTAAETAVEIADQTGWTGTAILASSASYGMVDALTSGPLAKVLNAPILLQEPGAVLNAYTKAELIKLNITKVYVTSGTAVISQAVLDELADMKINVVSLGGVDRFETSAKIANEMVSKGAVSKVAVAYGWLNQDALSIAAIASASNQPILLTEKNAVPASVKAFLDANASVVSSDVIGGTGVISEAVKATLPNAVRHAGNTAYDTNDQVIKDFASSLDFDNVYVANGKTAIDALAGAPLAAQTKSAIVLTDGTVPAAATFVNSKLTADSVVTALGGTAVVPESVLAGFGYDAPVVLGVTSVNSINATQVEVVFNGAVDATDAAILSQYSLDAGSPSAAVVADDKMSVKLTFGTAEATSKVFAILPIKSDADANITTALFTQAYTYEDTLKPVIASVTSVTAGATASTVVIKASEPIAAGSTLKIDGISTGITFVGDTATVTGLSLDSSISHTMEVLNLTDLAATPNVTAYSTKTFTATVDATIPTATLAAKGDKNILVTFSKPMNATTVGAALVNGVVKSESLAPIGTNTAVVVPNTDNTQYVIEITDTLYTTTTSRTLNVVLPATMTDSLGNPMVVTTKSVTLSKDTVKPVATGFSVVKNATGNITDLVVTFNEGLDAASAGAITPPTIIDADGVLVTSFLGGLTSDAVTAGDKTVTYSVTPAKVYGVYEFSFANALVSDQAEVGNTSAAFTFDKDFGTADAGTGTFDLATADETTSTSNIIDVDFGVAVKGGNVTNSATALSSYTLNGKALPVGTTITLNGAKEVATITLPADGIATADTDAVFTVSGVKSTLGLNVTPYVGTVAIVDNTAPVLLGAQVVGDNVILTFNETMGASADDIDAVLANYEIKAGTTTVVPGNTGIATAALVVGDSKKVQISFTTVGDSGFDATKTITVKTLAGITTLDASGIAAKAGVTVTATK